MGTASTSLGDQREPKGRLHNLFISLSCLARDILENSPHHRSESFVPNRQHVLAFAVVRSSCGGFLDPVKWVFEKYHVLPVGL